MQTIRSRDDLFSWRHPHNQVIALGLVVGRSTIVVDAIDADAVEQVAIGSALIDQGLAGEEVEGDGG